MKAKTVIYDTAVQKRGMYAVMRHSSEMKRAHFCALHNDYQTASAEAIRLLGQFCAEKPERQHHFYVVKIDAVFSAGVEGLKSDEP